MGADITGRTAAQIASSVRGLIEAGHLVPGDALPPIRQLAAERGVNRNTVAAGYASLSAAGLVQSHGRGGTIVAAPLHMPGEGMGADAGGVNLADGNPDETLLPRLPPLAGFAPPLYGAAPVSADICAWAERHLL